MASERLALPEPSNGHWDRSSLSTASSNAPPIAFGRRSSCRISSSCPGRVLRYDTGHETVVDVSPLWVASAAARELAGTARDLVCVVAGGGDVVGAEAVGLVPVVWLPNFIMQGECVVAVDM